MKEKLKKAKADVIFSAVLCVVVGVVLLLWPAETIGIFCKVLAVGLVVMGAVYVGSYIVNSRLHPLSGILGLIVLLVGVWIFLKPESVVSLIPIVIGVILVFHGVQDVMLAFETRGNHYERWWGMLIIGAISLIAGVIIIVDAFGVVTLAVQFIGVALLYDGISDLWIVTRIWHAMKMLKQEAEALDVEGRVMDEEE